jgi:putative heme-binding domain-containing protein
VIKILLMLLLMSASVRALVAQERKLPSAVMLKRAPDRAPSGEREWPILDDEESEKIRRALPPEGAVNRSSVKRRLLVFFRTDDYPHLSIPHWNRLIELLAERTGAFEAEFTQRTEDLNAENLKRFDAVFFNNTCRMRTPTEVREALQAFVRGGKGFAGNHGSGDNWHDWEEGTQMMGAEFINHPFGSIRIKVDEPEHPLTKMFSERSFPFSDEIYTFRAPYSREKLRVLLSIDYAGSPDVAKAEVRMKEKASAPDARPFDIRALESIRADHDYPLAWVRPWGAGRVFYCALGHRAEVTFDSAMVRFFLEGIRYALGDVKAPDAPVATVSAPQPQVVSGRAVPDSEKTLGERHPLYEELNFHPDFEVETFATPPQMNSPVFIAASPTGDVFVSSDPNGAVGTAKGVGKIFRLRDVDGDGHADESKEYVQVDAPRGILVDGKSVIVLHPPHLSAFIDHDGDGVSDEEKVLVRNIGWPLSGRRADHASNGIEMGIDGWIYAAIGDFGFMQAEGADGRTLQLRGGGMVRVRPDGTGLELYSAGTRNILEAAISPLLDGFARDNTNDGGGWNTRFHHFSGLEDHGYPRLYKNFADEAVAPMADYGGGSGCGAVWVEETGWPVAWNRRPYTIDWGRQMMSAHSIKPNGATFLETEVPRDLVALKVDVKRVNAFRPTDADVDARGHLFVASWRDGGFGASPSCGLIFRVRPRGHSPAAVPMFEKVQPLTLVEVLRSGSHRSRLAAQRELLSREESVEVTAALLKLIEDPMARIESRVAGIFGLALQQGERAFGSLEKWATDPVLGPWALRAMVDHRGSSHRVQRAVVESALSGKDARLRREGLFAAARMGGAAPLRAMVPLLEDEDAVVAHTAVRALVELGADSVCFEVVDDTRASASRRSGALRVLQSLHEERVVTGLIAGSQAEADKVRRRGLLGALCRLYHVEGVWAGDSWGTRPDHRGPYYQPEPWAESTRIAGALTRALGGVEASEVAWLGGELARQRVDVAEVTRKLLEMAARDASVVPPLVRQLAQTEDVPQAALPLLVETATGREVDAELRHLAAVALTRTDSRDAFLAVLRSLHLPGKGDGPHLARRAFQEARHLENHYDLFIEEAGRDVPHARSAVEALTLLAGRMFGAPEARAASEKALMDLWERGGKVQRMIVSAARDTKLTTWAVRIAPLVKDENKELAEAAVQYFKTVGLDAAKVGQQTLPDRFVGVMGLPAVVEELGRLKGDARRGQMLFTQQGCVACHTVKPDQTLKGPYLGNIAATYGRPALAEAILEPGKSIAQGFATNVFRMNDGREHLGFVVREAAQLVTFRTIAAQEITVRRSDIKSREVREDVSLMPPGLAAALSVEDFASLVAYLEELNANANK